MADGNKLLLDSERLGPLSIINGFIERLRLEEILVKYLPPPDE